MVFGVFRVFWVGFYFGSLGACEFPLVTGFFLIWVFLGFASWEFWILFYFCVCVVRGFAAASTLDFQV